MQSGFCDVLSNLFFQVLIVIAQLRLAECSVKSKCLISNF